MKQKQPHRHREKPVVAKREKGWAGRIRSLGLADGHLHRGQRNNEVLLCSSGDYVLDPVIHRHGKERDKECTT